MHYSTGSRGHKSTCALTDHGSAHSLGNWTAAGGPQGVWGWVKGVQSLLRAPWAETDDHCPIG
jgi:hypothetical protein